MNVLKQMFRNRGRRKVGSARTGSACLAVDLLESRLLLTAVNMTDQEQLMLELINRARLNPAAEAARQGISLNSGLPAGTITTTPKQPLAPHQSLNAAAVAHALDMLNRDYFDHTTQGTLKGAADRAVEHGYPSTAVGENISWGGTTGTLNQNQAVLDRHRALFLSPGHRENLMVASHEEIGVGIRYDVFTLEDPKSKVKTNYNAAMVVNDFGRRNVDPFITGLVYTDSDNDNFYDIGESIRSGTVRATNLTTGVVYSESLGRSGVYGIPVSSGNYSVTATYTIGGQEQVSSRNVTVGTANVKVDFDTTDPGAVTLTISGPVTTLTETGASSAPTFQVTRSGDLGTAVTVNLTSSDTSEATVPATVSIPAGQASASFVISAVDDGLIDGNQIARITATVPNYAAGNVSLTVADRTWPTLPATIQTVTTARPEFSWTSVANAATYQLYVNNVTTGQTAVINQSGLTTTSLVSPVDLPIGDYNVWVRGITSTGLVSIWSPSATWKVRTVTTFLNSGRTERSPSFTLEWEPVPGASSYDVWIDRQTSKTSQYFRDTNVTGGASLTVTDFAIGKYAIWVRARNLAGQLTGWSRPGIFHVNLPVSGLGVAAVNLTSSPTVSWNPLPGAGSYDFWMDNLTTGQNQVVRNTSVGTNSLTLSNLPAASYRVWVRARDIAGGYYAWSPALSFEFGRAPQLQTPIGSGNSAQPLFAWTAVSGAVRYELVIADEQSQPLITESNLTGLTWVPGTPLASGTYRAWIRAFDSNGTGTAEGSVLEFSVARTEPFPATRLMDSAFVGIDQWLTGELQASPESLDAEEIRTPAAMATFESDEFTAKTDRDSAGTGTRVPGVRPDRPGIPESVMLTAGDPDVPAPAFPQSSRDLRHRNAANPFRRTGKTEDVWRFC